MIDSEPPELPPPVTLPAVAWEPHPDPRLPPSALLIAGVLAFIVGVAIGLAVA